MSQNKTERTGMSAARCSNVDHKGVYSAAPTLRRNATTSGLRKTMATLRAVLPSLQGGGRSMRMIKTEIRSEFQKHNHNTKSETNFKHKCAPVLCIHVSVVSYQQLASGRVTIQGSAMQSGALFTRTENQNRISKTQLQHKI